MSSPVSFAQLVLVQIAQRLDLYHQGHRHPDVDMKLAKSIGWSPDKGPFQAFLAMERHHRTGKHGGRRVPPRLLMHTIKHPSYMDSIINSGQSRSQKGGRGKGMTVAASESSRSMPTATESKPSSAGTGGSGHGRVTGGAPQGGASRHRHHHHHHHQSRPASPPKTGSVGKRVSERVILHTIFACKFKIQDLGVRPSISTLYGRNSAIHPPNPKP